MHARSKHLILVIDLYNFCTQCYYYENLFCTSLSVTSYQLALYTSSITLYSCYDRPYRVESTMAQLSNVSKKVIELLS